MDGSDGMLHNQTLFGFGGSGSLGYSLLSPLLKVIRRPLPTISADTGNALGCLIILKEYSDSESRSGQY
jgi:hypothetical protein